MRTVTRELFTLSLPVVGLNVLNVLSLAVDTAMCGRLPNAEPVLSALGFAIQIVFLLMVAMMGLAVGAVALVARAHGAGDHARASHIVHQATLLTVALGIAIAVVGNAIAPQLLTWLGATPSSLDASLDYLRPLLLGTAFHYLSVLYASLLRAVGNTRLPFMVGIVSNLLNAVFNYGLIFGHFGLPALGIFGAAIGTVASTAIGVGLMVWALRRDPAAPLRPQFRLEPIDVSLALRLFRIGAPAALDLVIVNAGFLSILGMLARIDPAAVAAHGIGLRIQALAFVPGLGISQATGALVGQALGAGQVARAKQVAVAAVVLSVVVMTVVAIPIVFAAAPIIGLFDVAPHSAIGVHAVTWMRLLGYGMPAVGVFIALVGVLRGAGATGTSLAINLFGTLLVQVPLSAALGFSLGLGAAGVWLAFPVAFVCKAAGAWLAYRHGSWARAGVTL